MPRSQHKELQGGRVAGSPKFHNDSEPQKKNTDQRRTSHSHVCSLMRGRKNTGNRQWKKDKWCPAVVSQPERLLLDWFPWAKLLSTQSFCGGKFRWRCRTREGEEDNPKWQLKPWQKFAHWCRTAWEKPSAGGKAEGIESWGFSVKQPQCRRRRKYQQSEHSRNHLWRYRGWPNRDQFQQQADEAAGGQREKNWTK